MVGLLLAIFLLGMGLRLYQLDTDSLWLDEIITANQAHRDLLSAVTHHEQYTHPPLIDIVTWLFIRLSGDSDFVVRLQAVLFGSLSIALVYKLGETLWTTTEGMMAAFLLAANAYHIRYSQEARSYALMVFLALFSLVFLTKALRTSKTRYWVGFILCTSLSLYNHYFAFLFLPAAAIFAVVVIAQNWRSHQEDHASVSKGRAIRGLSVPAKQALMLCVSLAAVCLSYVPWLPSLQGHLVWFAGYQGGAAARAPSIESSLSFLHTALTSFSGLNDVGLFLWLGVLALGLATSDRRVTALMASCVGVPLLFLALVQNSYPTNPRYVLFMLPLCLLVIARGIASGSRLIGTHLLGFKGDRPWALSVLTTLAALALVSLSFAALRDYYLWQKEDWRGAAAFLQENMGTGDVIVADGQEYHRGGDDDRTVTGLRYYFSLWQEDFAVLYARQGLAQLIEKEGHPEAQVWGVLWHSVALASLDQVDEGIQIVEFPWVAIVKLTDSNGDRQEDAATILEALRTIQPNEVARFDLGLALAGVHRKRGETAEAEADLAQAESVRPEFAEAYIDLGKSYCDLLQPDKALAVYQQGLEQWPQSAQLYVLLGETYLLTGSMGDSVTAFERALEIDANNDEALRTLQLLSGSPGMDIPSPIDLFLGGRLALLGYDLRPQSVVPGGTVEVTVWWQALQGMERDYSMFLHVVGPDSDILVQDDRLLEHNQLATSQWQPGQLVKDQHTLRIPSNAQPGEYTLIVGAYYWETGERLAVRDAQGRRIEGDAVSLTALAVHD